MGKSSLISTFVSRHFSDMVPGIMTRVRLPPDPSTMFAMRKSGDKKGGGSSNSSIGVGGSSGGGCVTTIIDTQGGGDLMSSPVPSSSSLMDLNNNNYKNNNNSIPDSSNSRTSYDSNDDIMHHSSDNNNSTSVERQFGNKNESNIMHLKTSLNSSKNRTGLTGISIDNVDVIVLVYDLDRIETFYRLENHWLPFIERCFKGEVSRPAFSFQ